MQQFLAALPLLACPVGMGVMMWWMSRNGRDHADAVGHVPDQATEVARLRAELDQLRAAHVAQVHTDGQQARQT
jgi:hypothetical protein